MVLACCGGGALRGGGAFFLSSPCAAVSGKSIRLGGCDGL